MTKAELRAISATIAPTPRTKVTAETIAARNAEMRRIERLASAARREMRIERKRESYLEFMVRESERLHDDSEMTRADLAFLNGEWA